MVLSPDSTQVASASCDGTVKVWDAATGAEIFSYIKHPEWVVGIAFSPDGRRVASTSWDGTV